MKLSERRWEQCGECGHNKKLLQEEAYGCDTCRNPIDPYADPNKREYLEATVFNKNDKSERLQFCSWKCTFKSLRKVRCDYFISLPYLTFDTKRKGQTVKDFWKEIKTK